MKSQNLAYPHPILLKDNNDYENCVFELSEPLNQDDSNESNLYFELEYTLTSNGLKSLIEQEKAAVVVRFYSPKTAFRESRYLNPDKTKIELPKNKLAEEVQMTAYIIAKEANEQFNLAEHNKELFNSAIFQIRVGDKLAETETRSLPLDSSELQAPVVSVINISKDDELKNSIEPDFNSDKINIRLNSNLYDTYNEIKGIAADIKRYLSAVIVYPVLIDALAIMKNPEIKDEYMDFRWYKSIERKLEKKEILLEDEVSLAAVANSLLGDIINDALTSFCEKIKENNEE